MSEFDASGIMYAGAQPHEDDKRLLVVFSLEARLDQVKTESEGRNVYKDVEFVTIRVPGDKLTTVHRPVRHSDKMRFPLQYAAFKNNRGEEVVGTPLHLWPGCKPSQVAELAFFNVRTVEQLAAMPDGVGGSNMMGIQALRQAARQYVAGAKEQAPLLKVQKELESRDNQIAALTDQIANQGKMLAKLLEGKEDGEPKVKKGK